MVDILLSMHSIECILLLLKLHILKLEPTPRNTTTNHILLLASFKCLETVLVRDERPCLTKP